MTVDIALSIAAVFIITVLFSKFIKLSPRYDRKPRAQTPWQKLDSGDDPSVEP